MINEKKLREKLAEVLKRNLPTRPFSFAKADALIDEIVEAATVEAAVTEEQTETKKSKKRG